MMVLGEWVWVWESTVPINLVEVQSRVWGLVFSPQFKKNYFAEM